MLLSHVHILCWLSKFVICPKSKHQTSFVHIAYELCIMFIPFYAMLCLALPLPLSLLVSLTVLSLLVCATHYDKYLRIGQHIPVSCQCWYSPMLLLFSLLLLLVFGFFLPSPQTRSLRNLSP